MKRVLTLAILAVSFTVNAQEAKPDAAFTAREAKAEKLFLAMHIERTMAQMMGMMQQMILQSTKSMPGVDAMTPEQQKLVTEYQAKSMRLAEDSVGWKVMEPEYARLYAASFTDAEIDAMTLFYNSPAGQAMVEKTPQISQQTMQAVQSKIAALQPQLRQMAEQLAEQMKAASPTTPKPAPSK